MATMNPKVSIKAQSPEKVPYMAPSHSGVAAGALSAAGMSSRVSRRVDVSPEHLQPLPDDVEAGSTSGAQIEGDVGTLMVGVKLQMSEVLIAWLAVVVMTLSAILSLLGTLILSYFNQQISVNIGMTDAQYGMLTGYAYYLLFSIAMTAQGYCIDRYSLNRVYVVGFGGLLGGAALLIQGFATSFTMMLIGMVLSAVGGSVFAILPIPILSDILPPEQLSFAGAIFSCAAYLAEALAGNLAFVCDKRGISWRWAVVSLGIGCVAAALATFAFIREPPVGRFIVKKEGKDKPQKSDFTIKQTVTYMASMSSMWILTIATGLRLLPLDLSGAYMPSYYSALYPSQTTVFTAMASIVGICGLLASFIYGAVCQRFYVRLPTISLYTTAIGAVIASGFVSMTVCSRAIAGGDQDKGYGIALTGMSLAVLIGEGWQGPLTVMLTLALPPDIKSFAISLWSGLTQLIGPATSVLFGIYLTIGGWKKGTPEYIRPARIFMLAAMLGSYLSAAALYLAAIGAVKRDIAKREALARTGGPAQITLSPRRKMAFIIGSTVLVVAVAVLIIMSFFFSYDPDIVMHPKIG